MSAAAASGIPRNSATEAATVVYGISMCDCNKMLMYKTASSAKRAVCKAEFRATSVAQ